MPWVRVDDAFYDHGRFENVSLEAIGLYMVALAWSNRNLKDGRIPKAKVRSLHTGNRPKTVRELVAAGLWVEAESWFEIHDYLHYQKDAATILKEREAARRRKAKSRVKPGDSPLDEETLPPDRLRWGA